MTESDEDAAAAPTCQTCGDPLGGSPGNWYSLVTEREQCGEPFHYHEPVVT